MVRLLREDCYEFDLIPKDDLDDYMPYSYEVINCSLDFPMDFSILCDGSNDEGYRLCSDHTITPRFVIYEL